MNVVQDLRFAARSLARTPAFGAVAVLTLALGIGANTAIFTVVNGLLFTPLPYPGADRLVMLWQDMRERGGPATEWGTPGNFVDWQGSPILAAVTAVRGWGPPLTGIAEPEPLVGEQVSREYFDVLGIGPARGRVFTAAEDLPNGPRVAILSHALWQRRFGGDPSVIGRIVTLGGEPHEIVGIMPADFRPAVIPRAEIWRPLRLNRATPARGAVVLRIVARLRPGVTLADATVKTAALATALEQLRPEFNAKVGITVVPLHEQVVGNLRLGLLTMLGAVGFVLLIACVNIASLLLARASGRTREIAVRCALGARRSRIVAQLLIESLLLASIGGALGLLVGVWGVAGLVAIAPEGTPRLAEVDLNRTVLGFAAALTMVTGLLFGLVPALLASRGGLAPVLENGARGTVSGGGGRARRALIVAEVATALVLLVGGGLLMRTFVELQAVDLGFNPDHVLAGLVVPPQTKYGSDERHIAFYDRVLDGAAALPGVRVAALTSVLPLGGDSDMDFLLDGMPMPSRGAQAPVTWYRLTSAGYFDAMGIPIVNGRSFSPGEAAPAVVVNEAFAKRYCPDTSAIGRRMRFSPGQDAPWFTIVGVARDIKSRGARASASTEIFLPYWQFTEPGMNIVLKTATDPVLLAGPLRQMVRTIDPDMPVSAVMPMTAVVANAIEQPRFVALLVAMFASLALALAGIGIFGVMSYSVAQRTAEIGVRVALGAGWQDVVRLVVGDSLRLACLGIAIGALGALLVTRALDTLLFGVRPWDPLTFAATASLLLLVAALASFLPARRAMRVDPVVALRRE